MSSLTYKNVLAFLFCIVFLNAYKTATAAVTVTPASGGVGISADKSKGSTLESFTTLNNIVIASNLTGDFPLNQSNATFVLSAPSNWEFNIGTGSVAFAGGGLTAASISVTSTTITVTYSTGAVAANNNSLTISGIQVKCTSKAVLGGANITRTSGSVSISGLTSTTNCGTLSQTSGAFSKLQVLLPGENAAAGTLTGKTGAPAAQLAGTSFNITVNGVDENWNRVSNAPNDQITISSSDLNAAAPANNTLSSGTRTFSITLRSITNTNITAANVTNGVMPSANSANVVVNAGPFVRLLLLLPGESIDPKSSTGKIGTPDVPTAGTSFNITVNAVDAAWNTITAVNDIVRVTSSDVNAVLPANAPLITGTRNFNVTLRTAASRTLTASDLTDAGKTASTGTLNTSVGAFSKLQVLLPGETAAPGSITGKTGTPNPRLAGSGFYFTVNAVDACWNRITSISDQINILCSDVNATLPANAALALGTKNNFRVTFRSPGTHTIVASNVSNGAIKADTSSVVTVNPGNVYRLQILLPGETAAPGTPTGKTGTPLSKTAGESFPIIINAVDVAWNKVNTSSDIVRITSRDVNAILPPNTALISGTITLSITLKTAGSRTITAANVSDPTKASNTSPGVMVNAAAFKQLQVILPGETASPGSAGGKTGSPSTRLAGTSFGFTVNAVDAFWNRITSANDLVAITSSDTNAILPANGELVSGTRTNFRVTFRTKGLQTITAINLTNDSITANTSTLVMVSEGAFARLQLLVPGEIAAPGTATGKTGIPLDQVAGTDFEIIVNAVDAAWNVLSSAPADVIRITSTDVNAVLPTNTPLFKGTITLPVKFKTAGSRTILASDVTNGSKTANRSPSITVNPGLFSRLQLLLPGERSAPGTTDGKTGNPATPERGTAFNVTVNAVDENFNRISTAGNFITITSSDGAATIPGPANLAAGTRNFNINLRTFSTQTITASTPSFDPVTVSCVYPIVTSNATDHFRSATSGSWNDAASWQSSPNGTTWNPATLTPTSTANSIAVRTNDEITISANVSADQIIVQNGATVIVNGGVTLTLANGAGTDMDVYGTVKNAGVINTTAGNLVFQNTGKYQHTYMTSAGTIPVATWNVDSECEILGYTSANASIITGANQSFYNLIWDCPNQNTTSGPSLGGTFSADNFTIISTGTGDVKLGSGAGGGTITIRNYSQTGGKVTINNTGSSSVNLNISGNFYLTGGTMQKGTGTANVNFSGNTVQTFAKSSAAITGAISFNINNGTKVDFGTDILDGTDAVFTLSFGGTIITANDQGIASSGASGSIQTLTRNFSNSGNYIYNADNPQIAGTGLPLTVNNLTINTPAGLTLPSTSVNYTINGNLDLSPGSLDMGTNNLIAGSAFSSSGTGTLYTQSISASPLSAGKTWNIAVEYNGTAAQNIAAGTYSNLSFSSTGTKTATAGAINVTGNWLSADGKLDLISNNTTVVFNGVNQNLVDSDSDDGNGVVFKNVSFANSGTKTLTSGKFSVATLGLLTMTGTATLNANGNLYILSNETGSGNIGPIPAGADIIGDVNVQTFITGGLDSYRSTRSIASPINDASLARKSFQQLKDFILITGPGNIANGFDLGGSRSPNAISLQMYNEPAALGSTLYSPVPSINVPTIPGKGYFLFFRGNRDNPSGKLNTPYDTPEDVLATYIGPLNKGNISNSSLTNSHIAGDTQNGYNFVGNPYASAIDWNAVLSNSPALENLVVTIKPGGGTATYINGISNGGASRYLQTGLGFYVKVKDTENNGSINFTETCKVGSANLAAPTRLLSTQQQTSVPEKEHIIRMGLTDGHNTDEATMVFKQGYSSGSQDDALYLSGSTVSLGTISSDERILSVNFSPDIKEIKEIKLWVNASESKNASLFFSGLSGLKSHTVFLKDSLLNTLVELKNNTEYHFTIDKSNPESFGNERFKLLVAEKPAALQVLAITAKKTIRNTVELTWTVKNTDNIAFFSLEKSGTGDDFASITDMEVSGDASNNHYKYIDNTTLTGRNYYRIKQTTHTGKIFYSDIVYVDFGLYKDKKISIYPNPVIDETTISFENFESPCTVTVFDLMGKKLFQLTNDSANASVKLNLANLNTGIYILETRDFKTKKLFNTTKLSKQ